MNEARLKRRRVRRRAAAVLAAAGLINLVSAVTPPVRNRLGELLGFVPLTIPQAATAGVALAGLALLMLSLGVRRGQRPAWVLALSLVSLSALLHILKGFDVEEATILLATGGYLIRHRAAFDAESDRASVRRGLVAGSIVASAAVGAATVVVRAWPGQLPKPTLGRTLIDVSQHLVGARAAPLPGRYATLLEAGLFALGCAVTAGAGWLLCRPVADRRRQGKATLAHAREIVTRHGSDTLSYFALRADKRFFFHGETVVAYAVVSGVCLVSPDPIGPVAERAPAWEAFHAYTDAMGWPVAVLGATEEWLPIYRQAGMRSRYVGDEAVVECAQFSLDGGRFKGLRQAVNRVARKGYTVEFFDPARLTPALRAQLRHIGTKSRRGEAERGFSMTLGRLFDPADEGLLLAVAFDAAGTPAAFCHYVPASGIEGYSLDVMRRSDAPAPNGLTDFVVVKTIHHLRDNGYKRLALNFATMRAVLAGEAGDGLGTRIEHWLLKRMSASMQIESLWYFNAKYDPSWHPRFAVYDGPEHVLPSALAVARAESFCDIPLVGRLFAGESNGSAHPAEVDATVPVDAVSAHGTPPRSDKPARLHRP
jgi:lysyl-tRNA synthetase class 2